MFFTGPNYKERLESTFEELSYQQIEEFEEKFLAKVLHPYLPRNTFRTNHPNNLRFTGRFYDVLNTIVSEVSKRDLHKPIRAKLKQNKGKLQWKQRFTNVAKLIIAD